MKKIAYATVVAALFGCADEAAKTPANRITFNDFEAVEGWNAEASLPSLTKERAHSGTFAVRVGNGVDFSLGYRNALGKIGRERPRKIKVQAWVYVPSAQANCLLVAQIHSQEQNKDLFWDGIKLTETTKALNKWVLVEKEMTLPATVPADSQLLVYLWRNDSPQPTYIDDLSISSAD